MFDLKTIKSQLGKKIFKGKRVKMVEKHCTHLCSEKLRNGLKWLTEISRNDWFFVRTLHSPPPKRISTYTQVLIKWTMSANNLKL